MREEIIGNARLILGDCREALAGMEPNSLDACVTDPPYELGFMGRAWDRSGVAFDPATWAAVLRVLKPGAHLVAFGAPKNYHRLACAIEDAGFEIRDSLMWLFGSGFPKSHNLDGDRKGWGTALKPAFEPIILARKPLIGTVAANVLAHGVGAINVDGCRVGDGEARQSMTGGLSGKANPILGTFNGPPPKPITTTLGRWPANIVHDGSDEVVAGFPSPHGAGSARAGKFGGEYDATSYDLGGPREMGRFGDTGSAARFFYSAKASAKDRAGSKHPTVKPVALMRWLVRLVTPPGGLVLDPFAGSGTTGQAASEEGFDAILIEREPEYAADIKRRLSGALPLFAAPAAELQEALL